MKLELNEKQMKNFWNKVDKNKSEIFYNGTRCWEWVGGGYPSGYGTFRVSNLKKEASHRISYFLEFGEFESDLLVCHHCDNTKCVNPGHLFLGTFLDNQIDMLNKGRGNRATGSKNGTHTYPERVIREENSHFAKLTKQNVLDILYLYHNKKLTQHVISEMFGITIGEVGHIVRGIVWKETYIRFCKQREIV